MLILLTNDDGILSPGILAMYRALTGMGEVMVVAPETVQSAAGHGITLTTPLLTSRVTVENGFTGTAVDGRPADCVKLAIDQLLPRRPDLVVSGINAGANVGINVVYSGTIAAAIEAAFLGVPAVATSLHLKREVGADYAQAAVLTRMAIQDLLAGGLAGGEVVNVNIPALHAEQRPAGVRVVRQCTRPWADTYERRQDPRGRDYFWNNSVFRLNTAEDDTDVAALRDGFITITPLQYDLSDHRAMSRWGERRWTMPGNAV